MSKSQTGTSNLKNEKTGSPKPGEPVYLAVGRLGKPHGIQGEILLHVMTDFPERLLPGKKVFWGDAHQPLIIHSVRESNKGLILSFREIDDINQLTPLKSKYLFVDAATLPALPKGEYYHHQLIGLNVQTIEGDEIGMLSEIIETGANDVYVVKKSEGGEELVPALKDTIISVDLDGQVMVVKPLIYFNQE